MQSVCTDINMNFRKPGKTPGCGHFDVLRTERSLPWAYFDNRKGRRFRHGLQGRLRRRGNGTMGTALESFIRNRNLFGPLFPAEVLRRGMAPIDLSTGNAGFGVEVYGSTDCFISYIRGWLSGRGVALAHGGYRERREMYARSPVFDAVGGPGGPRRIHMGLDFWGEEGTPVLAPCDGTVHSSAMNPAYGDYGATMVLRHEVGGFAFHVLYGHLSEEDLWREDGSVVRRGECVARFGGPSENGGWPPHLHLQVVMDMGDRRGDYPGVCSESELEHYSRNCPDPKWFCGL